MEAIESNVQVMATIEERNIKAKCKSNSTTKERAEI
jgi:hypothetical protein